MTEAQYYQTYLRNLTRLENGMAKQFVKSLNKVWSAAASLAANGMPHEAKNVVAQFIAEQKRILTAGYIATANVFGQMTNTMLIADAKKSDAGPSETKVKLSADFWAAINKWAKVEAAKNIQRITDTTKKLIAETVEYGINKGESNATIAGMIGDLKIVSNTRAMLIARTETHNASGQAANTMAAAAGYAMEKKWLSANDERTRAWHKDVNGGEWIDMNAKFDVDGEQMMYPGDSSASPRNLCNCRCAVMYRKKAATGMATPPPVIQQPTPVPVQKPTLAPKPAPVAKPVATAWQDVAFKPAATIDEAVAYAKNVLKIDADFSSYCLEAANQTNEAILDCKKVFGDIPGLKNIRTFQAHGGVEFAEGYYSGIDKSLHLKNVASTQQMASHQVDLTIAHARQRATTKNPKHTIYHEIGHAIIDRSVVGMTQAELAAHNKLVGEIDTIFKQTMKDWKKAYKVDVTAMPMSWYGMTKPNEFFAEAFAETMGSKTPRTLSVRIARLAGADIGALPKVVPTTKPIVAPTKPVSVQKPKLPDGPVAIPAKPTLIPKPAEATPTIPAKPIAYADVAFKPAETIEDAMAFAKEKIGFDANYAKLKYNIDIANALNREVLRAKQLFGEIKELKGIEKYRTKGAVGYYLRYTQRIGLRGVVSKNMFKNLASSAVRNYEANYWSTPNGAHVLRHEIGHAVRWQLSDAQIAQIEKIRQAEILKYNSRTDDTFKTMVSRYGINKPNEFIAESIAQIMSDGYMNEVSEQVLKIIQGGA